MTQLRWSLGVLCYEGERRSPLEIHTWRGYRNSPSSRAVIKFARLRLYSLPCVVTSQGLSLDGYLLAAQQTNNQPQAHHLILRNLHLAESGWFCAYVSYDLASSDETKSWRERNLRWSIQVIYMSEHSAVKNTNANWRINVCLWCNIFLNDKIRQGLPVPHSCSVSLMTRAWMGTRGDVRLLISCNLLYSGLIVYVGWRLNV